MSLRLAILALAAVGALLYFEPKRVDMYGGVSVDPARPAAAERGHSGMYRHAVTSSSIALPYCGVTSSHVLTANGVVCSTGGVGTYGGGR